MKKSSILPAEALPATMAFRKVYDAYHERMADLQTQIEALQARQQALTLKEQPRLKRLYSAIGDVLGIELADSDYYVDSSHVVDTGHAFLVKTGDEDEATEGDGDISPTKH